MKKLKHVALMVFMMMVAVLASSNVYADEYTTLDIVTIETDQEVYYEGETINLSLKFADEYYNLLDSRKITDFEMYFNEYAHSTQGVGGGPIEVTPVLENLNWSNNKMVAYYIQMIDQAKKIKFIGGETIATSVSKVHDEVFREDGSWSNGAYKYWIEGMFYFDNDTSEAIIGKHKEVTIAPFEVGDITRDHEVDFFDITNLISVVYEMNDEELEQLDWRKIGAITSNTKEYTTDENYDIKTAELGFMDIIYLIKTVYG